MRIKGINLGGWLLMEGYILGGRNIAETTFKRRFEKIYGKNTLLEFEKSFRDNFITENDFKNIAELGANTIRLPFNYRLIEKSPFSYSRSGVGYLQKALRWAKKHKLKVILDLHAAPGAQNFDWHSDSSGKAGLWQGNQNQKRTIALWEFLIDKFKNEKSLLGYDLINEPVLGGAPRSILVKFYRRLINKIREIDEKRIIFIEGDLWATQIDFLKSLVERNISISIHNYEPLQYTFNFTPFYKFPGKIEGGRWDKKTLIRHLQRYYDFSRKYKTDIFVGEFGINWRGGFWGEASWLKSTLEVFDKFRFGYTYWTYKAISNSIFPDGIYQYIPNTPCINREGPEIGWEKYLDLWGKHRKSIIDSWKTKNYTPAEPLITVLKKFFKGSK